MQNKHIFEDEVFMEWWGKFTQISLIEVEPPIFAAIHQAFNSGRWIQFRYPDKLPADKHMELDFPEPPDHVRKVESHEYQLWRIIGIMQNYIHLLESQKNVREG